MLSTPLAAALNSRNIHYGWVMAGLTFLIMLTTACALGAPGVLMPALQKEFGWTTADISAALALRLFLFGAIAPFAAWLMMRYGLQRVVSCALALIVAGLGLSMLMKDMWQLVLFWGVFTGVGAGMTAIVLGATVATRWFNHRRGLVIGLLTASSATGQLAFLPLIAQLDQAFGWRTALILVCGLLATAFVLVLLLMRDRPSDLGLPAYGDTVVDTAPPTQNLQPFQVLKDAAKTRTFWVLFGTFFICGASTNGLIQTHFVSFCGDYGMIAVTAAGVLALMGLFDFIGTIGSGWLSDRYDSRWLLFAYYGLRGISLLFLPNAEFTFFGLAPFAVFYGLDWIATVPPTLKLAAEKFGKDKAGIVFGWVFAGHQLGAASIAFTAGFIRTTSGKYDLAFLIAGALCLLAALLALTIIRPKAQTAPAAA
ncbi:major Facilitator Superfamily protein [Asticcacaulis biprosthecium C19]|uniref:Major Facilitator Superfamily protein n=1 Tax=Asticcacaulis biprosthecium C19 TaxID=715226 RepID=F4QQ11_9CAUL|nr:MFS transporter [Asticcacaulis biprosthecium]EGF90298.1 major Facilitator Superfamily protein [Asticcacaulis biprosthecium C19]